MFLGPEKRSTSSSISFEQFVIIAAFWRVPSLVPDDLKRLRIKRVGEVELMAHALTIYRFLRGCVARTRQTELQPLIAEMTLVSAVVRFDSIPLLLLTRLKSHFPLSMNTSPARAFPVFIDKAGGFHPLVFADEGVEGAGQGVAGSKAGLVCRQGALRNPPVQHDGLSRATTASGAQALRPGPEYAGIYPKIDANIRKQPGFARLLLQHQKLDVLTPQNVLHVLNGSDTLYFAGVKAQRRL